MQDATEPTIMWMGLEKKEATNKDKQKGHIKEAGGGVGWADLRWKLDVEAIIKGLCKGKEALGLGNIGLMGTTQQFQVMS